MEGRKGVSQYDLMAALVLLLALSFVANEAYRFQNIHQLGFGAFSSPPPRPVTPTTPVQLLTQGARWNHMPITVFADTQNVPATWDPAYLTSLEAAMHAIEEKTGGLVAFKLTPNSGADISIRWVRSFSFAKTLDAVGHTELTFLPFDGRALIKSAEIEILTRIDGRQLSAAEMQNTALHELGHALGLNHTDDKSSMMFPTANEDVLMPNSGDADTLRQVYREGPKADLAIRSAYASKKAQKSVLLSRYYLDGNITIENIGYIDVSDALLRIKVDSSVVHEETLSAVQAGQSIVFTFQNIEAPGDFSVVQFEADPENSYSEYTGSNNVAVVTV
jgi:hypothetical protein